jgi:O-antigen/teichoic acid export membrane protein
MRKNFNLKNIFQKFSGLFSIGIADVLGAVISSALWLYFATILDVEAYGEIFYIFAIGNMAISISLLGSRHTLMVYVPKNIKFESSIFLLVLIFGSIVTLITFVFYSDYALSFYILGAVIFGLGGSEILARKLYTNYFKFLIIQKSLMVALSLILYSFIGINGIILGVGLSFLPYLLIVIKEFQITKIDFSLLKPRLKFMMNTYGVNILSTSSKQIDLLMVAPLFGFTLLGNYQLGIQFIGMFQLIPLIVMKFTLPHDASGNSNSNLKIIIVLLSIGFTILIILFTPIIIPIFFEKFIYSIVLIQILSISLIPTSLNTAYSSKFLGNEKYKIITVATILLLLVHISGIFILGEIYGIIGVASSYVLSMSSQTIFYFIMDKRKTIFKF